MALISCPECGKQISSVASACPSCAYPLSPTPATPSHSATPKEGMGTVPKVVIGLFAAVAAFLSFGAYVGSTPEGKDRSERRETIARCWDEQKRKSLSPGSQQFIARNCEAMEQEFARKFGYLP